ncbi:MAG: hypothetical protein HY673_19645 [Chloroflexi bacterium]|nr:hypothetical protein [Chloroflexota bacterium]
MKENLLRLKTILEERERVFNKVVKEYENYKKNPPGSTDSAVTALELTVAALFNSHTDLVEGFRAYIGALEKEAGAA